MNSYGEPLFNRALARELVSGFFCISFPFFYIFVLKHVLVSLQGRKKQNYVFKFCSYTNIIFTSLAFHFFKFISKKITDF